MNYPAWQLKKGDPAAEKALAGAGCGVLLRRVLAARGCTDPAEVQALLGAGAELSDPFLLRDMDKAVARIEQAVENEETIVIYGDYDVDGITATCLMTEFLRERGGNVTSYIPARLEEGYGLNEIAIRSLLEAGVRLIVTVDCGITANKEAELCRALGIDLVVTDHHECKTTLPAAIAVVDPHRPDQPDNAQHDLAGVGVAFKLSADELRQTFQRIVLALHRDEHTVAGAQAVEGEQIQTGRAVDKDEVVDLLHRGQRLAQAALTSGQVDHFQTGTGQTGVGADDIGAVLGVPDGLRRRCPADEHLISARFHAALWDAIAGGGVALRVEIYDKHLFAQCRYAGRKVDGGGGFAHSALLVCDRYNFCHALFFLPGKDLFHMEHAVMPAGFPVRQAPWVLV